MRLQSRRISPADSDYTLIHFERMASTRELNDFEASLLT